MLGAHVGPYAARVPMACETFTRMPLLPLMDGTCNKGFERSCVLAGVPPDNAIQYLTLLHIREVYKRVLCVRL